MTKPTKQDLLLRRLKYSVEDARKIYSLVESSGLRLTYHRMYLETYKRSGYLPWEYCTPWSSFEKERFTQLMENSIWYRNLK